MSAAHLLEQIAAHGGQIRAEGTTIKLRAPKPLPADLVAELRREKPALLQILSLHTVWRVIDNGREFCTLITPKGATRHKALQAARFHWPNATVAPHDPKTAHPIPEKT